MNAFEATLLAYYTLRLPACPGYEKAAQFEGLMNFDAHVETVRKQAKQAQSLQEELTLFNIAWALGVVDWLWQSGYAISPELGANVIDFLESLQKYDSVINMPFDIQKLLKPTTVQDRTGEQILDEVDEKYKKLAMEISAGIFLKRRTLDTPEG